MNDTDFSPPTLPEGYCHDPSDLQDCLYNIRDTTRRGRIRSGQTHQIVARIFKTGKIVMWELGEPRGRVHVFETYNEARAYLETILNLGLIYENMPEIFTRR